MEDYSNIKFGFIRETEEGAKSAGLDPELNIPRTSLSFYLDNIFPGVEFIHDKVVPDFIVDGKKRLFRPDYYSPSLQLAIEFDGIPHYTSPIACIKDYERIELYKNNGIKLVRIPYFIPLTKEIADSLFSEYKEYNSIELFPDKVPSLTDKGVPSFLCITGVKRMAKEFKRYPDQYKYNIEYLKSVDPTGEKTDWKLLDCLYNNKPYTII